MISKRRQSVLLSIGLAVGVGLSGCESGNY
jgi:hypothetical protein